MGSQYKSGRAKAVNAKAGNTAKMSMMKKAFVGLSTFVLAIVIVVGAFMIITPHFGWLYSIVYSGSMEPAVNIGGVVVIRPADTGSIREGDIITFKASGKEEVMITHRVVEVLHIGDEHQFRTKGDANEDNDKALVASRDVMGKVWLDVPYLGYVMDFMQKPLGFGLVIGIPALIIILMEVRSVSLAVRDLRHKRRRQRVLSRKKFVPTIQDD